MASIEEIKAALAQAVEQSDATAHQVRSAADNVEQLLARLRAISTGTSHPMINEAIARIEQSRQHLFEAMTMLQGSAEAARNYSGVLG